MQFDRTGSDAHWPSISGGSRACRRYEANFATAAPALKTQQASKIPESSASRHAGLVEIDGRLRHPHRQTDEAAGGRLGTRKISGRERDNLVRFGNNRDVVGETHTRQTRPNAFAFRKPRDNGARPALRDRRADRPSRPSM